MPKATPIKTLPPRSSLRIDILKQALLQRRHDVRNDVHNRMRDGRAGGAQAGPDDLEHSEADSQGDLALALLQMQSETLARIDAALARLDGGGYGLCIACDREIATRRLKALPFAVRCQACEEKREGPHVAYRLASRGSLVRSSEMTRV